MAAILAFTLSAPAFTIPAQAATGERSLYLHYTHTGETARITFWKNGNYDQKGLKELNYFLRDWRRNEPTKMDPELFTLLWQIYNAVDGKKPIHIVSAYRAPATNEMLRSRSSGVAKNSQHTHGRAMDFWIPGVELSKLRATAMKYQGGGVGYYPTSGSPFVHVDTGSVRAWPRMTRAQLKQVFPDGKTLHLPTDGTPLSSSGRQYALAEYNKCKRVPCSLRPSGGDSGPGLLETIFGGGNDTIQVADNSPQRRSVASQQIVVAPDVPLRPADLGTTPELVTAAIDPEDAPVPPVKPEAIILATAEPDLLPSVDSGEPRIALASAEPQVAAPVPPRRLGAIDGQADPIVTAYAPLPGNGEDDPQKALERLINARIRTAQPEATQDGVTSARQALDTMLASAPAETDGDADIVLASHGAVAQSEADQRALDMLIGQKPGVPVPGNPPLVTASFNAQPDFGGLFSMFKGNTAIPAPVVLPQADFEMRAASFVAPDLDHVTELFTDPELLSSGRYAVMFSPDEADFDPATIMGADVVNTAFSTTGPSTATGRFGEQPLQLALR
ncbi:DUF882 domain-containing protein [Cucumibacter marinus]|uniref:DUF882 domain-containing protein n=1 Tax=Cucumibacter marinus TaxID=1121252 RepID=UPI00041AA272|nr:DUF882 domain-containing protein [Cucumibacter marinus]